MNAQFQANPCHQTDLFLASLDEDLLCRVIGHSQICPACKKKLRQADPPIESIIWDLEYAEELAVLDRVIKEDSKVVPALALPSPPKKPTPTLAEAPQIEGYKIVEFLGTGGSGTVWKAEQILLGRLIAVKVMNQAGGQRTYDRLVREIQILTTVRHANLVTVHTSGLVDDRLWMGMELCAKGSLHLHLEKPWDGRDAAQLIVQVARAAHTIHELGIIHRDIKPGNILLDRSGQPKLADFDLAQTSHLESELSHYATIQGTPAYIAPEQVRSEPTDRRTDVHGLGAVLYHLLTGRAPFLAETPYEVLLAAVHEDPTPPRQLRPEVPKDLDLICCKCLAKDPKERYATAAELAEDLERFLKGVAVKARKPGWGKKVVGWIRDHHWWIWASIGALGLGMFAAAVKKWVWG